MVIKTEKHIKTIAAFVTLAVVAVLGVITIYALEEYGWTVFFVAPFIVGFLPPYIVGTQQEISRGASFKLSFLTLFLALICLLAFAVEGLICIAMAFPIMAVIVLIGSYLGYKAHDEKWATPTNSTMLLLFICLSSMSFDYINEADNVIPVRTTIMVDAPIEAVWENVVTFNTIAEPTDWIFKTGISCPTDATIKGTGVGAIRYCNFTTGSFVEPITTWDEPNLLQFDVVEQPIPMNEFNPFWDIHPPHLDGYFLSQKGEFRLNTISATQTELQGTTWYTLEIMPQQYWKVWSDFVIHRIHKRVLNHIKLEAEG